MVRQVSFDERKTHAIPVVAWFSSLKCSLRCILVGIRFANHAPCPVHRDPLLFGCWFQLSFWLASVCLSEFRWHVNSLL